MVVQKRRPAKHVEMKDNFIVVALSHSLQSDLPLLTHKKRKCGSRRGLHSPSLSVRGEIDWGILGPATPLQLRSVKAHCVIIVC